MRPNHSKDVKFTTTLRKQFLLLMMDASISSYFVRKFLNISHQESTNTEVFIWQTKTFYEEFSFVIFICWWKVRDSQSFRNLIVVYVRRFIEHVCSLTAQHFSAFKTRCVAEIDRICRRYLRNEIFFAALRSALSSVLEEWRYSKVSQAGRSRTFVL